MPEPLSALLESVLDSLGAHVVVLDEHGTIIATNLTWRRFGQKENVDTDPQSYLGQSYLAVCANSIRKNNSAGAQAAYDGILAVLNGSLPEFHLEYDCHSPTAQRWFLMHVLPLSGARQGLVITHENITVRKLAEKELRWRTAFFEAKINSSPEAILVVDTQRRRILQNQRFLELFRVPQSIAQEKDDVRLLQHVAGRMKHPAAFGERVAELYDAPAQTGRDEIELIDGTILDRYSWPVRDHTGKYYGRIWAFHDITERRKLEAQYRQAQKMEAIGQLAGGVAHDFNNILGLILLQSGLLGTHDELSPRQSGIVQEIQDTVQRAADLTRQLLIFSSRQTMQFRELDLNVVFKSISKMLLRIVGEDIQMHLNIAPRPLWVNADAGMMDQILMNLTVNARDAMPGGGQLTIETCEAQFDEASAAKSSMIRPGSFACISVSDTGCGIPPEILPHVFEPFFTTKDVGKGTGLGLATVFGIVKQHQGWIEVDSEVGRGTSFRVYIPRVPEIATETTEHPALALNLGGNETILLVEDESSLRSVLKKTLLHLGYWVIEAPSGIAALEIWEQYRGKIHLLFTDLVLPAGLNGKDLARRLLKKNPGLKVIYASGYSSEVAGEDLALEEGINFLTKPFKPWKLAQTVRAKLDTLDVVPFTISG